MIRESKTLSRSPSPGSWSWQNRSIRFPDIIVLSQARQSQVGEAFGLSLQQFWGLLHPWPCNVSLHVCHPGFVLQMCLLWPSLEQTPNNWRGLYCRIQHFVTTVNFTVTVATYLRIRHHSCRSQKKVEGMKWGCGHFPFHLTSGKSCAVCLHSRRELWSVLTSCALPSPAAVRPQHVAVLDFIAQGPSETWWVWEETAGSAGDRTKHQKGLCTAGLASQLCTGQ